MTLALNTTGSEGIVNLPITLSANSEITGSATTSSFGSSASINLSSYNLTVNSSIASLALPALSGSGTLTLNDGSGTTYAEPISATTFTGPIVINSGSLTLESGNWGTGSITIGSGATLAVDSTLNTYTLPNNLAIAGNGGLNQGSIQSCLGISSTCEGNDVNTTLTLSGNVNLTGNTEVANGLYTSGESSPPSYTATFDFTGDITYDGYTLTAVTDSSTVVSLPAVPWLVQIRKLPLPLRHLILVPA